MSTELCVRVGCGHMEGSHNGGTTGRACAIPGCECQGFVDIVAPTNSECDVDWHPTPEQAQAERAYRSAVDEIVRLLRSAANDIERQTVLVGDIFDPDMPDYIDHVGHIMSRIEIFNNSWRAASLTALAVNVDRTYRSASAHRVLAGGLVGWLSRQTVDKRIIEALDVRNGAPIPVLLKGGRVVGAVTLRIEPPVERNYYRIRASGHIEPNYLPAHVGLDIDITAGRMIGKDNDCHVFEGKALGLTVHHDASEGAWPEETQLRAL